jgi:TRAP transporter TAXI family solute receptor
MLCAFTALAVSAAACTSRLVQPHLLIGAADATGTQSALSASICRLFNLDKPAHGERCSEVPSSGSLANIAALARDRIDIGVVESDVLAEAASGKGPIAGAAPATELRVLFAGHPEMLTVIARGGSGVATIREIRGKRINVGAMGSRQRAGMERVLEALGLRRSDFAEVRELSSAEQNRAFCAGELDVIVYSDAHPNGLIRDVIRTCRGALVDVGGPNIDRMLAEHHEFERAVIPAGTYSDHRAVPTFSVRALVVANTRLSDGAAYEVTRAVFDNFDIFRGLHPAFETLSIADMLPGRNPVPVHPGALRYYRERGLQP